MNKVMLTGNVTNIYDNTQSIKLSLADNYKDTTTYISVSFYGEYAMNFIRKYISKGDHIEIIGRIGTYKDNAGVERMTVYGNEIAFDGYKNPHKRNKEIFSNTQAEEIIKEAENTLAQGSLEIAAEIDFFQTEESAISKDPCAEPDEIDFFQTEESATN